MIVHNRQLEIHTQGKGTYEFTHEVRSLVKQSGVSNGMATAFVRHTSASLVIFENADSSARRDLHAYMERMVPEESDYFEHTLEGADDMPSHIRMALTRTSESIPIIEGNLALGTWQGIFLFEHRRSSHTRSIILTVLGI